VASYKRTANGGWTCEVDGVRFTFFRPTPGCLFLGVDYAGDWHCKAYFDGDEMIHRARTREEGVRDMLETIADIRAGKCRNCWR